jgi:hypothetical protein
MPHKDVESVPDCHRGFKNRCRPGYYSDYPKTVGGLTGDVRLGSSLTRSVGMVLRYP